MRDLVARVSRKLEAPGTPVVLITSAVARYFLRQILEPTLPQATVLSHNEVPPETKVKSLGFAA
jgi:flagellar biosynthesis component FlhA